MNYATLHPNAVICYVQSDMILHIHSDASFLLEPKALSRAGGHYFLSSLSASPNEPPIQSPPLNGPLFTISCIMQNMMGLAAKQKLVRPTSMAKKQFRCGLLLRNSVIPNLTHPCR